MTSPLVTSNPCPSEADPSSRESSTSSQEKVNLSLLKALPLPLDRLTFLSYQGYDPKCSLISFGKPRPILRGDFL